MKRRLAVLGVAAIVALTACPPPVIKGKFVLKKAPYSPHWVIKPCDGDPYNNLKWWDPNEAWYGPYGWVQGSNVDGCAVDPTPSNGDIHHDAFNALSGDLLYCDHLHPTGYLTVPCQPMPKPGQKGT